MDTITQNIKTLNRNIFSASCLIAGLLLFAVCGKAQVNQQTGSAVFDIPIFNFQDNVSNLSLPVSLNYSSGYGLKVDEVASEIGQGWNLMAGGRIVRLQVGEPDDQKANGGEGSDLSTNLSKYPNGYLYTNENPAIGAPDIFHMYPVFGKENVTYRQFNKVKADRELDYFMLNVNGISATFVLKKGTNEGIFLGNTPMKVKFDTVTTSTQTFTYQSQNYTVRTVIKSFTVTDGNGIQYVFSKMAYTKLKKQAPSDRRFQYQVGTPHKYKKRQVYHETFFDDANISNPWVVNEWHLTSINDKFVAGRPITLNYASSGRMLDGMQGFDLSHVDNTDKNRDYGKVIAKKYTSYIPVLTSITLPNNYSVTFNYNATGRFDLPGSFPLSSIDVKYNGSYISRHILKQAYVIYTRYGTPISQEQKWASRLYLRSVTKQTDYLKDEEKPYIFDYYLGGSNNADFVPPPFFVSKDIFGYYDGFCSLLGKDFINNVSPHYKAYCVTAVRGQPDHEFPNYDQIRQLTFCNGDPGENMKHVRPDYAVTANFSFAKNGLLKSVRFPAGGSMMYEYEQNKGKLNPVNAEQDWGGVHVSKVLVQDGDYGSSCTPVNPMEIQYKYINADGNSSLWGIEQPKNWFDSKSQYQPFSRYVTYKPWQSIFGVKCDYKFKYPGIQYLDQANYPGGFMKSPVISGVSTALGVYSSIMNVITIARWIAYGFEKAGPLAVIGVILDAAISVFDAVFTCAAQDDIKHSNFTTHCNSDIRGANPLPLLYKRVEVVPLNASNNQNGKTVNEYTSPDQFPLWVGQDQNPDFCMQQRYGPWLYGSPFKTTIYNSNGKKLKETENEYWDNCTMGTASVNNFKQSQLAGTPFNYFGMASSALFHKWATGVTCNFGKIPLNQMSCNIVPLKMKAVKSTDWDLYKTTFGYSTTDVSTDLRVRMYDVYSGKLQLQKTTERTYDQADDSKYVSKVINYKYDSVISGSTSENLLPTEIEEVSSSGVCTKKTITYNKTYTVTTEGQPAIDALNALAANNVFNLPVVTVTEVKNLGVYNSAYMAVRRDRTEFVRTAAGNVETQAVFVQRTANPAADINLITPVKVSENYYAASGILNAQKDEGGRIVRHLFDYDNQVPVANAINLSDPSDFIAYTSFETSNTQGFTYTGTATTGTCITGAKYYNALSTNPVSLSFSVINRPYTLSFWASTPIAVSNASLVKSGPVRNTFTYYEYMVNSGVTSVALTGTAKLDELRFYPADARISTNAYQSLTRKISECDQNGRTINYVYDNRGRLRLVKDDQGSILKMYEYNDQQQPLQCSYSSHAVYEVIQKTNCTAGYVGGYVEYYIQAGKYTSTISQEHADMLAQQEFDSLAQAYANSNAACIQTFTNTAVSGTFYSQNCNGAIPNAYVYTVPADKYTSTESAQDAQDQADDELADMGQAMADLYGGCSTSTQANWESDVSPQMRCQTSGGLNTGKTEVLMKDINPNSATYNQTQWLVMNENVLGCTTTSTNVQVNVTNPKPYQFTCILYCTSGPNAGTQVTYQIGAQTPPNLSLGTVPPGIYTISLAPASGSVSYEWSVAGYFQSGYGGASFIYGVDLTATSSILINIQN